MSFKDNYNKYNVSCLGNFPNNYYIACYIQTQNFLRSIDNYFIVLAAFSVSDPKENTEFSSRPSWLLGNTIATMSTSDSAKFVVG